MFIKRTYNALTKGHGRNKSIRTIGELLKVSRSDLNKFRGLGEKGITEIIISVHILGLRFEFEGEGIDLVTSEDCIHTYYNYRAKLLEKKQKQEKLQNEIEELEFIIKEIESMNSELSNDGESKVLKNIY